METSTQPTARRWRAWLPMAALSVATGLVAAPAAARPVVAEIALVLDVSGSVSDAAFVSQRDGWAAALRDVTFIQAVNDIWNSSTGINDTVGVSIGVYLFASNVVQEMAWTWLPVPSEVYRFADALQRLQMPRPGEASLGGGSLGEFTNLAEGVDRARVGLDSNAFEARRRVVAISANGEQNTSRDGAAFCDTPCTAPVHAARDEAEALGVMVAAVALNQHERELDAYMASHLTTSDGIARGTWGQPGHRPYLDVLMHAITVPADHGGTVPEPGSLTLAGLALASLRLASACGKGSRRDAR